MTYRAILYFLIALVTAGCGEQAPEAYMPSEDALVLAKFEQLLKSEGIEFTQDQEGYYSANIKTQMGRLVELGHQSLEIGPSRGGVLLNSNCASNLLQEYLSEADVVYIILSREDGLYLETTKTDYNSHMVANRYASYLGECFESLNKSRQ